jgi:cytochrome oxidase assembly protein ShyY1
MTATFAERIAELRQRTDLGQTLHGSVTVDQVYAHYQHEHLEFRHPRGGHAFYLTRPLMEQYRMVLAEVARDWLGDGGKRAMEHGMERLSDAVEVQAPVEFYDLRRSGHPEVRVGQRLVYDRQPKQRRLTEQELRAKNRLRPMPKQLIGWIWWHVMHEQKPPPRRPR